MDEKSAVKQIKEARDFLSACIQKKIVQEGSKWCVYSEDGSKNLGCYGTKEEAVERLRQVEGHKKHAVSKGLPAELTEAGIHIHGLERENKKTKEDGAHEHIFLFKSDNEDYGYILISDEDGAHTHELTENSADDSPVSGEHSHLVPIMNGEVVETSKDGAHSHNGLQVMTTAFDGGHVHTLEISGSIVAKMTSLTGGQVWKELEVEPPQEHNPALPPASVFARMSEAGRGILGMLWREADHAYNKSQASKSESSEKDGNNGNLENRDNAAPVSKINKRIRDVRVVKADEDEEKEERTVFGVVLIPETPDAQGDVYDAEEVKKAAYSFMEIYGGHMKIMHRGKALDDKLKVLETYLSKQEISFGDEAFPIGTWFVTSRVCDDEIWSDVKEGKWTGYSMGGSAIKEALD
jgi:hypothetical protein